LRHFASAIASMLGTCGAACLSTATIQARRPASRVATADRRTAWVQRPKLPVGARRPELTSLVVAAGAHPLGLVGVDPVRSRAWSRGSAPDPNYSLRPSPATTRKRICIYRVLSKGERWRGRRVSSSFAQPIAHHLEQLAPVVAGNRVEAEERGSPPPASCTSSSSYLAWRTDGDLDSPP
jgi:hypothetical protein